MLKKLHCKGNLCLESIFVKVRGETQSVMVSSHVRVALIALNQSQTPKEPLGRSILTKGPKIARMEIFKENYSIDSLFQG